MDDALNDFLVLFWKTVSEIPTILLGRVLMNSILKDTNTCLTIVTDPDMTVLLALCLWMFLNPMDLSGSWVICSSKNIILSMIEIITMLVSLLTANINT